MTPSVKKPTNKLRNHEEKQSGQRIDCYNMELSFPPEKETVSKPFVRMATTERHTVVYRACEQLRCRIP